MTHAEEISLLVEYCKREAIPVEDQRTLPLLMALGCSTLFRQDHEWIYTGPRPVSEDDEPLVRETLVNLLAQLADNHQIWSQSQYSLLDGLSRHDRWRACLADREQTYMLAAIVLHYSHCSAHSSNALTRSMSEDVHCMLSSWLNPKTSWPRMPSLEETATAMFGDAWWDFVVVSAAGADKTLFKKALSMTMMRPDFLPGAVSFFPTPHTLTLPPMDDQ
jgi:hypothetical protein